MAYGCYICILTGCAFICCFIPKIGFKFHALFTQSSFFVFVFPSGVDLRSSKVCELGLLNYKAKHVLYPFERKKFRCHHDYYWASIFKVNSHLIDV